MRTILIITTAFLAVTATALASGRSTERATPLSLVAVEQHCGGADLPPRDGSPGDINMCRGRLQVAGTKQRAGRAAWFCPYTGAERDGDVCTAVASLHGGDITLAAAAQPHERDQHVGGHGGTGNYAGARGTAVLRPVNAHKTAVTISLL